MALEEMDMWVELLFPQTLEVEEAEAVRMFITELTALSSFAISINNGPLFQIRGD